MAQDNLPPQSDQELQFKKRARRRLVGAVAVVLLMIIVLPMILQDRTAQAPKQDVVVAIPSLDQKLETASAPEPIQEDSSNNQSAPAEAVVENKPAENSTASAQLEASKIDSVKSEVVKTETAKPEPKPTANYFVQIGVFSDPENVKQMQDKLNTKSLQSRIDLIDTAKGKKTRLRVGPFGDKKEAESAIDKMKSIGLTGVVVSAN